MHVTGILFFLEKQIYCEFLEFQFISAQARTDTDGGIAVPWKPAENKTNGKSVIEQIANTAGTIHKCTVSSYHT